MSEHYGSYAEAKGEGQGAHMVKESGEVARGGDRKPSYAAGKTSVTKRTT